MNTTRPTQRLSRVTRHPLVAALVLLCALLAGVPARAAPVLLLEVHDAIGPPSADYIVRGLAHAAEAGAPLVVIGLDTPGGLDSSMRQIIQAILASPMPVAVYVSPEGARAASAGTYILYAAHIAAMAPATTLGAATPVAIGLPGFQRPPTTAPPAEAPKGTEDTLHNKQVHDAAAFIRGLAQQRGRNAEWAEQAVREAVSLTAAEALRQQVIDVVATDVPDLLAQIDGRTVRLHGGTLTLATRGLATETRLPDWRQRLLSVITNPSFALVLMMVGIYGLVFEFASPGFGVAGVAGGICLLLGLYALQMLPVNYAGLGLILLGLALMAAELLTPTLGMLGAGGVVAFIAGALLLFDRDVPGLGIPLPLIVGLALSSAAVVLGVGRLALRARHQRVVSGREELLGATGEVLAVDGPQTWARVHGERWQVRSADVLVPGQAVQAVALHGLTLEVRAVSGNVLKGGSS